MVIKVACACLLVTVLHAGQVGLKEGVELTLHQSKLETREEYKEDHRLSPEKKKEVIEKCNAARQMDAEPDPVYSVKSSQQLLGPPGVTSLCKDVLADIRHGIWTYERRDICSSAERRLNVLCTSKRTVGYGDVNSNDAGAVWHPVGCALRIFTPAEACALMKKVGRLFIVGESFQRQIYQGVLNVLTDDYELGSIKCEFQDCCGEKQYNEKVCRHRREGPLVGCNDPSNLKEMVTYWELWCMHEWGKGHTDKNRDWMKRFSKLTSSNVILFGIGMHDGLHAKPMTQKVLLPFTKFMSELPKEKQPYLIWNAMHAQGKLKPKRFLKTQGNYQVIRYNKQMEAVCAKQHVPVMNFFNMTMGAHSFDGSHYGMTVNVLKSHVILNYLAQITG